MLKKCKFFIFFVVFLAAGHFCWAARWHVPRILQYKRNGISFWIFVPPDWKPITSAKKFKAANLQIHAFLTVNVLSGIGKLEDLAAAYLNQESWIISHKKIILKNGRKMEEVICQDLNHPSRVGIGILFMKKGGLVVEESEISKDLYPLSADELWSLLRSVKTHQPSLSPFSSPSNPSAQSLKPGTSKISPQTELFPSSAASSKSASSQLPPGEKIYQDPKDKYEFFYPESWKVQHIGENPLLYQLHGSSFQVLSSAGGMFKVSQKKILPMYEQSLAYAIKGLKILHEKRLKIHAAKVKILVYSYRLPHGKMMKSWALVMTLSKISYLFVCTAPRSSF